MTWIIHCTNPTQDATSVFPGLFAHIAEQRVWISSFSLHRLGINPKGECVSACVFVLVRQGQRKTDVWERKFVQEFTMQENTTVKRNERKKMPASLHGYSVGLHSQCMHIWSLKKRLKVKPHPLSLQPFMHRHTWTTFRLQHPVKLKSKATDGKDVVFHCNRGSFRF